MSPEINASNSAMQQERTRQGNSRKRVIKLVVVCIIAIIARFVIKDPPPPKSPDHSGKPIKIIPGMLHNIPLEQQKKMDPKLLARMREADEKALNPNQLLEKAVAASVGSYKALDAPLRNLRDEEAAKDYQFQYKERQKVVEATKEEEMLDFTKPMLVRFQSGGYVKAEKTSRDKSSVSIRIDRTIVASLPQKMVSSVTDNAATWEEPVPAGFKKIKPAKGITIILTNETAKRVTIPGNKNES